MRLSIIYEAVNRQVLGSKLYNLDVTILNKSHRCFITIKQIIIYIEKHV